MSGVLDALSSELVDASGVLLWRVVVVLVLVEDVSGLVTCGVVVLDVDVLLDVDVDVDVDVEELVPAVGLQISSSIGSSTIPRYTRR